MNKAYNDCISIVCFTNQAVSLNKYHFISMSVFSSLQAVVLLPSLSLGQVLVTFRL